MIVRYDMNIVGLGNNLKLDVDLQLFWLQGIIHGMIPGTHIQCQISNPR